MNDVHELIIVGSGPAGYTAATYAARAELHPVVFQGSVDVGGALMNTTDVENFPGFPDGVLGPDLMESMRRQAERFGAHLHSLDVMDMELDGPIKTVVDDRGARHHARSIVLATGSQYRQLGLTNEARLSGRGESWCATCDGFFFRGRNIVVVGGGDTALEEATFLTRFADRVTVVHRRDRLRASKAMQLRAAHDPKVDILFDHDVVDILGDDCVDGVVLRHVHTEREHVLPTSGVFVAIGHEPRTDLVRGRLALDPDGYVQVRHPTTRTSVDGVFACGDVVDRSYRQAATAVGTGCAAALDAERYLASMHDRNRPVEQPV